MVVLIALLVILLCAGALVVEIRELAAARRARVRTCEADGHDFEMIFAFQDPRMPVLNCRRCPKQIHICHACGRDLHATDRVW